MIEIGIVLCLLVMASIVVPAWPTAPKKPAPKPKAVGYDKTGKLIYEAPKKGQKIDLYA